MQKKNSSKEYLQAISYKNYSVVYLLLYYIFVGNELSLDF